MPSPAFIIQESTFLERKTLAPGLGCRITIISTFIERILLTVSINVSPFEIEEPEEEKFTISADNLF